LTRPKRIIPPVSEFQRSQPQQAFENLCDRRINQAQLAVALLQQASLLKLQQQRSFD